MEATTRWTAPWGRSEMEATTGWTEGKPWEIAWGEVRGNERDGGDDIGARKGNRGKQLGESSVGKEQNGSDDRVNGVKTVGHTWMGGCTCK